MKLYTNSGSLVHKKKCVLQDLYRSVLCNINAGSITLHGALHDGIVALMWDYRLIYMYG